MRGHRKVKDHIWSFYLQVRREKHFKIIVHDFKRPHTRGRVKRKQVPQKRLKHVYLRG